MIKVYNTLTRKKEVFKPIKKGEVGIYSCGPTVYDYAHIGNLRTFIFNDLLKRMFLYNKYKVKHVMNITDVDDKTIKGSKKEHISLKDFTSKYEKIFFEDLKSLNIILPSEIRATESIADMVKMVKKLLDKGYAYKADDGIYFSISKFKDYGKLAGLDKVKKTKKRIISDIYDKENAQDFALWKFYTEEDGDVFWETELGKGRPGWHIECSAMSTKALGNNFDLHTGAIDLIFPHHTNEIAQSECASGKKFVNYWMHAGFLNMKEGKMSKSLGNIFTLRDLEKESYSPVSYRYLCLLTQYRKPLIFSFENLDSAKNAFERLKRKIIELKKENHKGNDKTKEYESNFLSAINDDLNIPLAIQVFWKVLDDFDFDSKKKLKLLEKFDSVFGLDIEKMEEEKIDITNEIEKLVRERESLRKAKKWAESDIIRERIKEKGYNVLDTSQGPKLEKIK